MSRIALGLMRISNMSVEEVEKLVFDSLDLGINFFDLADIYGGTKCESLFGEVLKRNPELRDKIYLQSKIGIIPGKGYDLSYDYIVNKTKESIERLQCGYLDSLLLHRIDIFMDNEEVAKAIQYLLDNHLIKDFGVSNFSPSELLYLEEALPCRIKVNQVNLSLGNTDMIDQTMYTNMPSTKVSKEADSLFFFMKRKNIAIQCWSPYQYGHFEGSIFNAEKYPMIHAPLEELARKYNTSKTAIATAFLLMLTKDLVVITGSTNIEHIKESLDGESINLSKEDWYYLYKESGHLLP